MRRKGAARAAVERSWLDLCHGLHKSRWSRSMLACAAPLRIVACTCLDLCWHALRPSGSWRGHGGVQSGTILATCILLPTYRQMNVLASLPALLIDGLLCRCPRCHRGPIFARGFTVREACVVCGLPFESASGEVTGGMGISISLTLLIVIVAAGIGGFNESIPLPLFFAVMGAITILFPIVFYRPSRALWIGFLYAMGDHTEGD